MLTPHRERFFNFLARLADSPQNETRFPRRRTERPSDRLARSSFVKRGQGVLSALGSGTSDRTGKSQDGLSCAVVTDTPWISGTNNKGFFSLVQCCR